MSENKKYYTLEASEVLSVLQSHSHGLTTIDAEKRVEQYGFNELSEAKRGGIVSIFFHQFKSPLIFILLVSSVIVLLMGDVVDFFVIVFVLVFNAIIGTIQEGKAQNTFLALKRFIKGNAVVLRDDKEVLLSDRYIVPGDIIVLREGEKVSADARIISANALSINESALTGESLPKHKHVLPLESDGVSVSDQVNMVFKGTVVNSGNGRAVVVATGEETFLGEIARETLGIDADFPLKKDIERLSRFIIAFIMVVACVIFGIGFFGGYALADIFKIIVATSVSVIPEGLPIVITIVLASGVWRMGKKQVLVKKLQAIEVLGETKILAVDKTGTVTKNELAIEKVSVGGQIFSLTGNGYVPEGSLYRDGVAIDSAGCEHVLFSGKIAMLNASASLIFLEETKEWKVAGDPTEGALFVFGKKIGFDRDALLLQMPMVDEIPFDYEQKYHASLHQQDGDYLLAVTGSPEKILSVSEYEYISTGEQKLTQERRHALEALVDDFSREGLRVIGFGYASLQEGSIDRQMFPPLVFGGFFGIKDTIREEVRDAVEKVEKAGIRVVMITGDHSVTAQAIAREAGIYRDGDGLLDGREIALMDVAGLMLKIRDVRVFSRVTPEHKLKIIQAYRANGMVVAMTGDGVNDALSLSAADIGIGMGNIGTDVAKEAADVLLLDDNFGNIVHGVEEGRSIFVTIKKVILYLFCTSIGMVLTLLVALVFGWPIPILAVQVLWLNLVTGGFLDVALAMDPQEGWKKAVNTTLVDKLMIRRMAWMAMPMMIGTLYLFSQYYESDINKAWTVSLTVLAVFQWFNVWNCRSTKKSIFSMNPFSNKFLIGAMIITVILQLFAVYNPLFQRVLRTVPLGWRDWVSIVSVAFSVIIVEELRKYFSRKRKA